MSQAVYRAALPHRYTLLYNTQKSRHLKFRRPSAHSEEIRRCTLLFLCTLVRSLRSTEQLTERSVGFPCLSVIFVCKLVFSKNSEPELRSSSIVGPFYCVQAFSSMSSNCEDQSACVIVIVQCIGRPRNRKLTCKNTYRSYVIVIVICWSRNLSII